MCQPHYYLSSRCFDKPKFSIKCGIEANSVCIFPMPWSIGQRCTSWQTYEAGCRVQSHVELSGCQLLLSCRALQQGAQQVCHGAGVVSWLIWSSWPGLCPRACARLIALSELGACCGRFISLKQRQAKGSTKLKKAGKGEIQSKNKGIDAGVVQSFQVHEEAQCCSTFVLDHRWNHLKSWNVTTLLLGAWGLY